MESRKKALDIANAAKRRAEQKDYMDTCDTMLYAIVLVLADIGQQLDYIEQVLEGFAHINEKAA